LVLKTVLTAESGVECEVLESAYELVIRATLGHQVCDSTSKGRLFFFPGEYINMGC